MSPTIAIDVDRVYTWALRAAIAGAVLALIVWIVFPHWFYRGYLAAFLLWSGVPLGCGAILMTHVLVGGRWGRPLRPLLESAIVTVPLLVLFFIPVVIGLRSLYPWTNPQEVASHAALQFKRPYLNIPFFLIRAVAFFAVWCIGGWGVAVLARRQDRGLDPPSLPPAAAAGLILYCLTVTFAGIDWIASLQPEWYSSIFGMYIIVGQALTALALVTLAMGWMALRAPPDQPAAPGLFYDLGNLLLTLVVFHAYLAYFQFFIMWNGNVREHVTWYAPRIHGFWGAIAVLLILIHFFLPFAALLGRQVKRSPRPLMVVAGLILVARAVESAWAVIPSLDRSGLLAIIPAIFAAVAMGGLWLAAFLWVWRRYEGGPAPAVAAGVAP